MIVIAKGARAPRRPASKRVVQQLANLPTPEMIEERAAEIRKRWSPRVLRRRRAQAWQTVEAIAMPLQPRRKGFWGD